MLLKLVADNDDICISHIHEETVNVRKFKPAGAA
jgi:hypothetical protein